MRTGASFAGLWAELSGQVLRPGWDELAGSGNNNQISVLGVEGE